MKIYFVSAMADGCLLYRVHNPAKNSKFDVYYDIDLKTSKWKRNPDKLREADMVIFHRPYTEDRLEMMKLLQAQGKIVGYDNDDTFKMDDDVPIKTFLDPKMNDECIRQADFVTASTEFLADEYRKLNKTVYVIPNLIDFKEIKKPKKNKGKFRILVSGSVLHLDNSNWFSDVLKWLDTLGITIIAFGLPNKKTIKSEIVQEHIRPHFKVWEQLKNVEWHPYVNVTKYYKKLNSLKADLALIPRKESYFNKAKSNIKYLEMSAFEIPTIAQSFKTKDSPYDTTKDAPIILARTKDEWKRAIIWMIENKEERIELGKKAREYVEKNYGVEQNYFDKIIGRYE